ncbi:hypothetical protein [Pseudomonas frederiksbergensis]|uniref:Uncharacterized protein n=1 Tax=Pseudomonas frederiksbergensis TaxID=104087 RepID=A0A6L5BX61_9PSED|nr:hypothetical protein [Pseudomonas frederiksbergensis]KAF2391967.1 hypothetical protein FX983_06452 [Pseudomonas frederiksbergensis]
MAILPDFRLETYFAKWEFSARYHMTASDAQSMCIKDLLALTSCLRSGCGRSHIEEGLQVLRDYLRGQ